MRFPYCLISIILISTAHAEVGGGAVSVGKAAWIYEARRLTGESALVRERAITRLKATRDLEKTLQKALTGRHRFLALDVVTALQLRSMMAYLLKSLPEEPSGYVVHAVNTLIEARDRAQVFQVYREQLKAPAASPANQVAILDSFSRTTEKLDPSLVEGLLRAESPEVRSAVVYYLRSRLLKFKSAEYFPLLIKALRDRAFQNRLEVYSVFSELPPPLLAANAGDIKDVAKSCAAEDLEGVREFCMSRVVK